MTIFYYLSLTNSLVIEELPTLQITEAYPLFVLPSNDYDFHTWIKEIFTEDELLCSNDMSSSELRDYMAIK